jgi:hypothetical protein
MEALKSVIIYSNNIKKDLLEPIHIKFFHKIISKFGLVKSMEKLKYYCLIEKILLNPNYKFNLEFILKEGRKMKFLNKGISNLLLKFYNELKEIHRSIISKFIILGKSFYPTQSLYISGYIYCYKHNH